MNEYGSERFVKCTFFLSPDDEMRFCEDWRIGDKKIIFNLDFANES